MTALLLVEDIRSFIEKLVQEYYLETDGGTAKAPQVVAMELPHKKESDVPDYPCVIIRPIKGQSSNGEKTIQINLIFGAFSEYGPGWQDVLTLSERADQALSAAGPFASRFTLEKYEWELFEDQPKPEWIGQAVTTWSAMGVLDAPPIE